MRRGRRGLNLDYAALYQRYLAGETGVTLAAEAGIDYSGLYASWKRRGFTMRSGSEAAVLRFQQRPDLRANIKTAQAARRGTHDPMVRREQRAQTREARGIGISHHEVVLASELHRAGHAFRQQAAIGPYNVDFAFDALRLVLEVDGGGHNPRVRAQRATRQAFIEAAGWRVARVETRRDNWITMALAFVH